MCVRFFNLVNGVQSFYQAFLPWLCFVFQVFYLQLTWFIGYFKHGFFPLSSSHLPLVSYRLKKWILLQHCRGHGFESCSNLLKLSIWKWWCFTYEILSSTFVIFEGVNWEFGGEARQTTFEATIPSWCWWVCWLFLCMQFQGKLFLSQTLSFVIWNCIFGNTTELLWVQLEFTTLVAK